MNLLVDIGNNRVKWATFAQGVVASSRAFAHHSRFSHIDGWADLPAPHTVTIASCNQDYASEIGRLARRLWAGVSVVVAQVTKGLGVRCAYQDPSKLGVDRWLNLIALQHLYAGGGCVIDAGSAITVDYLGEDGRHLGGIISPGVQLMQQSLQQVAGLPLPSAACPPHLANNTEQAIYSGTLLAATGLLDKMLADYSSNCPTIVLTGGDGALLAPMLQADCVVVGDFVLQGLACYCKLQQK